MFRRVLATVVLACAALAMARTQAPLFTDAFPIDEFAARRARVMDRIGEGIAIMQGASEYPAYVKFRQNNQFFYLSGVEVPRAILVIDGRAKRSTLFLLPRDERAERSEGPVLAPGADATTLTGIESVRPRDEFGPMLAQFAAEGRALYMPFRPEALGAATAQYVRMHAKRTAEDLWDGRKSREQAFVDNVKAKAPGLVIKDLDPILDEMRLVKSPREIATIRDATRIAATGIMEAMRAARPGMYEYELEAITDYFFKKNNSQGIAYFALVATGKNASYPHYHAAQSKLIDGDLLLFDYAPDYRYYTSDVTRMFPANGRFTAEQRELYTVYLKLYQAFMTSIHPNAEPAAILANAARKMQDIVAAFPFSSEKHRAAAQRFADEYKNGTRPSLGHWLGMEVHDITDLPAPGALKPGMVFTIEPALTIPEEHVYIRIEDPIVITSSGYENLSAFAPVEPDQIERLMAEDSPFNRFDKRAQPTCGTHGPSR